MAAVNGDVLRGESPVVGGAGGEQGGDVAFQGWHVGLDGQDVVPVVRIMWTTPVLADKAISVILPVIEAAHGRSRELGVQG